MNVFRSDSSRNRRRSTTASNACAAEVSRLTARGAVQNGGTNSYTSASSGVMAGRRSIHWQSGGIRCSVSFWTVGPAALPCAGRLPPQRPPDTTPPAWCGFSCSPAQPAARRPATVPARFQRVPNAPRACAAVCSPRQPLARSTVSLRPRQLLATGHRQPATGPCSDDSPFRARAAETCYAAVVQLNTAPAHTHPEKRSNRRPCRRPCRRRTHRTMSCHEESAAPCKTGQLSCHRDYICAVNGYKCAKKVHKTTRSLSCHKLQPTHPVTRAQKKKLISGRCGQIRPSDTLLIPCLSPNRRLLRTRPAAVRANCGPYAGQLQPNWVRASK